MGLLGKKNSMAKAKRFKLIDKEFSPIDNEWQWTYLCLTEFTLNQKKISKITITDHYQLAHKDTMTNEKILEILLKLDGEIIKAEPKKKPTWPDVFVPKGIGYQGKKHLMVFWFERDNNDWIWVRDCYPD